MVADSTSQRARMGQSDVLLTLAFGATNAERHSVLPRIVGRPALSIVCGVTTLALQIAILVGIILERPTWAAPFPWFLLAPASMILWFCVPILAASPFRIRNQRGGTGALVQSVALGDNRAAPPVWPQPEPLAPEDIPAAGQTIGPMAPPLSLKLTHIHQNAARTQRIVGVIVILFGASTVLTAVLSTLGYLDTGWSEGATILAGSFLLIVGIGFGAAGIWVWRRAGKGDWKRYSRARPFQLRIQPEGVSWSPYPPRGSQPEYLAWRNVDAFCVATYHDAIVHRMYRLYFLLAGDTRLTWEGSPELPDEERAASDRLVGLAMAKTGLPLRDLMPGVRALSAALGDGTSQNQTPEERIFTARPTDMFDAPVAKITAWNRAVMALFWASVLLWVGSNVLLKILS